LLIARHEGDLIVLGTLALQLASYAVLANVDSVTGGIYGMPGIPRLTLGGWGNSPSEAALTTAAIAAITLIPLASVYRSPFARVIRATRDAPADLELLGRSLPRVRWSMMVVAGVAAGTAGALHASFLTYIDPSSASLDVSIVVVSAVIIGGAGRLAGAIAGASIATLLPEALRLVARDSITAASLQQALYGLVLLLCVRWRPAGLLGEYDYRVR
jgi:branched-chain amino acid transport system permease protein